MPTEFGKNLFYFIYFFITNTASRLHSHDVALLYSPELSDWVIILQSYSITCMLVWRSDDMIVIFVCVRLVWLLIFY